MDAIYILENYNFKDAKELSEMECVKSTHNTVSNECKFTFSDGSSLIFNEWRFWLA